VRKAPTIRFAVTLIVVGGAVMLSAVVAVVALTRTTDAGLGPLAWLLPLATLVVICGIGLMLTDADPPSQKPRTEDPDLQACPGCGHEVSGEWRLCPWCGVRLITSDRRRAA
jgi:hypothetical protein